ncbi:hypothetical protein AMS68_002299 [Peltaster fructicola]|uniref:FAD/NAD(P)-binding domain-containing protein n=1 Tax=Peltaster fructicola TaxID=286661 RepID=A0A6H0XPU1_9PEZI|nr:hypothetical protein AMS68_002299 [Peltaster fructicola]
MGSVKVEDNLAVHNVAIIGSGPSGLAAAKYLLSEQHFSKIVIFEQRNSVGGLWNYSPCDDKIRAALKVPQTDPYVVHDQPVMDTHLSTFTFMSPVYDRLETNIPRGLMGFTDLDWPQECQLFPKHKEVLEYIERYAADVKHLVEFETQVLDVRPLADGRWSVFTRKVHLASSKTEIFDAVIVASGHFNVPYIPPVDGIEAWQEAYPGSISHSKFFRRPETYAEQKVIVVGNSASGIDIAAQIRQTCKLPLLSSSTSESYLSPGPSAGQLEKPRITRFDARDRTVHFEDGSSESDVDAVLYCTGYLYSYPFLASLDPPVVSSGVRVENLFKHIFYRPNPTLSFVALNQKVIPFPVAEAQSAVIAGFYAKRLSLPSRADMERWEKDTLACSPRIRDFHVLKFPKDADYINELHDWAVSDPRQDGSPGKSRQFLKTPPYWTEEDYWVREQFPAIKKSFQSLGEGRHSVRTLHEIGFDFEKQ